MLGKFEFVLSADFLKSFLFPKVYFRNTIRVSNSLDADQTRHFVGSDLGPNSLQMLPADDTSKQRVEVGVVFGKVNCSNISFYFKLTKIRLQHMQ